MRMNRHKPAGRRFRSNASVPASTVRRSLGVGGAATMLSVSPLALSTGTFDPVL